MLLEGGSFDVIHHVVEDPVFLAVVNQAGDVGMLQRCQVMDLPEETLRGDAGGKLGVQDLEGHQFPIAGPRGKHPCGSAPADLAIDFITPAQCLPHHGQKIPCHPRRPFPKRQV